MLNMKIPQLFDMILYGLTHDPGSPAKVGGVVLLSK